MKRALRNFFFGILPVVSIVFGGMWYQRNSERAIQYEKNFQLLKAACQESAGKEGTAEETISEYVTGVCGCFAKTALKHRNIAIAGIINDQDIVHAILKDCSRRVPASKN